MSRESINLSPNLQEYLHSVSLRDKPVLKELRDATAERDDCIMQVAPEQGQFMGFLVSLIGARRILEVGTYTGYSALCMALELPDDGKIITLDVNPETTEMARHFWKKAGIDQKIEQKLGPALETIDTLTGEFDLVFIDADKTNYGQYYEKALRLLRPGGLVLIDNVLWSGRVADPENQEPDTVAIRALNQKIHQDPRVAISLLPLADGLTLARKL